MARQNLTSMQEVIRGFRTWMEHHANRFTEELDLAYWLFWGERKDVESITHNPETEMCCNEWLMLDFSVTGYDDVPVDKRRNLLHYYLDQERHRLSSGGQVFVDNMLMSYPGLYQVTRVRQGKNLDLYDLFLDRDLTLWDINSSNTMRAGGLMLGRICEDENSRSIGAGAQFHMLSERQYQTLRYSIVKTYQRVQREMTLPEFLKWNSYIYYRDVFAGLSK